MKNKEVTINFLLHNRYDYAEISLCEIFKLENNFKKIIHINLLVTDFNNNDGYRYIYDNCRKHNVSVDVYAVGLDNNYMSKILTGIKNSSRYAVSIDEDIFISAAAWTKFLENISILEDKDTLFFSPVITTGIPSVDLFVKDLPQEIVSQIEDVLLSTHIPNVWGADYSLLNKHTIESLKWCSENFYADVYKVNHHYKGVHPVRFSYKAQEILNNFCIENIEKLSRCDVTEVVKLRKPYFCNSVFAIKTATWKEIVNNETLFVDDFDEVPLNKYMENKGMQMAFLKGVVAVHPSYNTVDIFGHSYKVLSDKFFQNDYLKQQAVEFWNNIN